MFEATFKIAALVTRNEQGQRVFQVLKHGEPVDDDGFFSLVAMIYQQDVYRTLRVDDDVTVTVHLDLPPRDIERTLRFREDGRFEGEGIVEPTAELLPLISSMSEHFRQQVQSGDVLTVLSPPPTSVCYNFMTSSYRVFSVEMQAPGF